MPNAHASAAGVNLHEDKYRKQAARAASTINVNLASPGPSLDGVALVAGDRILLKDQTTPSQNGIYRWNGSAVAATRATDAAASSDFVYGFLTYVREGTVNAQTYWSFSQTAAIVIGTTSLTFVALTSTAAAPTEVVAIDFKPTGLTGATAVSRYVGATTQGPPTTGTFAVGDYEVDRSGTLWQCIVAGTPGSWISPRNAGANLFMSRSAI